MLVLLLVAAVTSTPVGNVDISRLFDYGLIGVFLVLFMFQQVIPGRQYRDLQQQCRDTQAKLDEQDKYQKEVVIPLVSQAVEATKSSNELLSSFKADRDRRLAELEVEARQRKRGP